MAVICVAAKHGVLIKKKESLWVKLNVGRPNYSLLEIILGNENMATEIFGVSKQETYVEMSTGEGS